MSFENPAMKGIAASRMLDFLSSLQVRSFMKAENEWGYFLMLGRLCKY